MGNVQAQNTTKSGSSPFFSKVIVQISAAQLKNIVNNPVILVEAPGFGKTLGLIAIALQYKYKGVAYTVGGVSESLDVMFPGQTPGNDTLTGIPQGPFLGTSSDTIFEPYAAASQLLAEDVPRTVCENQPLVVSGTSAPTLGNGDVYITVYYAVLDLF